MRRAPILLCLLALLVAGPAVAQARQASGACSILDTLGQIDQAVAGLVANEPGPATARHRSELARLLLRIDANSVTYGLQAQMTPTSLAYVLGYLETAQRLSDLVGQSGAGAAAGFMGDPVRMIQARRLRDLATRSGCEPGPRSRAVAPRGGPGGILSALRAGIGLGDMPVGLAAGLILLVLASIYPILRVTGLVSRRNQRRRRRHLCHIDTVLRVDREELPAEVLDISCNGAKIRLTSQTTPALHARGAILLGGGWQRVTVRWCNSQYLGLRFQRALPPTAMDGLLHGHGPPTKTAPRGVPLAGH